VEDEDVFGFDLVVSGDGFDGVSGEVHESLGGGEDYRRFFRISEDFFRVVGDKNFSGEFGVVFE